MKEFLMLYERKEELCGCTECYEVCPKGVILMELDEEGYIYPKVEEKKCMCCYMCMKVCPIK